MTTNPPLPARPPTGWSESHRQLAAEWPQSLVVGNKADLLRDEPPAAAWQLTTSALSGQGLAGLLEAIVRRLVPISPQPGEAVPFSPAHITALHAAQTALAAHNPMSAATILAQLVSPTASDRTARAESANLDGNSPSGPAPLIW